MHVAPKQLFVALLVGIFVGVIIFYSYYQSRAIIAGPNIIVEEPTAGTAASTSLIAIKGYVERATEITLQGRPIFINLDGRFSEQLLLMDGYNIIELAAKDMEGRIERKTIELVYQKAAG